MRALILCGTALAVSGLCSISIDGDDGESSGGGGGVNVDEIAQNSADEQGPEDDESEGADEVDEAGEDEADEDESGSEVND